MKIIIVGLGNVGENLAISLLEEDSTLGLQSKLQKQGQILNPEAIEILHLSSYSDDSAFRDEKSSLKLCRRLIYR